MATHDLSRDQLGIDRTGRRGSVLLVVLTAAVLMAGVTALTFVGHGRAEPYVMILLAAVGAIGVAALLAAATGILRVVGDGAGLSLFHDVVDQAAEGIVVTDAAGRVIYCNSAYRALAAASGLDHVPSIERAFCSEQAVSEAVYRLFKGVREGRALQEELFVAPAAGGPPRWIRLGVRPLAGRTHQSAHAVWTLSDATREHDDDALRKLCDTSDNAPGAIHFNADGEIARQSGRDEDLRRTAGVSFMPFFQNTPMAIATVDREGRIARTNGLFARLLQSTLPEGDSQPEGRSILDVVLDRDRPALEAQVGRAASRQADVVPLDAALAGKGERWARFYVTPADPDDGETAIVYALEITEQRSLENQLRQSQKLETVGQFAGGLAHDFNNVLSAIMMATDFLLNAHRPTDPSFQDIMQIKQNANRAASLVRQLLAFSRRQTLRPQVLDLGEALADLSILLRRLIGEKVTLEVHARDVWPVKADLSQFEQVIVNLAVNARDAMPNGGRLTVRASNVTQADTYKFERWSLPAGDYVVVEITDTGTGIAPEIIDRIFEPFFSTKEVGKGTGLGLSTVYGIVKQTGGFIYPQSDAGRGTSFRIYLPRYQPSSEDLTLLKPVPSEGRPPRLADDTGQGTILLVEDEEGLRGLNARGLKSRGYSVLEAGNGVEAIDVIDRHAGKIDLVVSDVVMPEMDGPALLKELRQRSPQLRIIFVSGYAEEAFAKSLPEGGQFEFLPKPFTLKQLIAKVKDTMSEQPQSRPA
jgi:two-component system, cell cycle sensor histidine kinase and response regulator CckA